MGPRKLLTSSIDKKLKIRFGRDLYVLLGRTSQTKSCSHYGEAGDLGDTQILDGMDSPLEGI